MSAGCVTMTAVTVTLLLEKAHIRQVQVRVSPLAELCACLHAFSEPEHHPTSHEWIQWVRATAGADLLDRCSAWSQLWGPFRPRYFFPMDDERSGPIAREFDRVSSLSLADFVTMTAEAVSGSSRVISMTGLYRSRAKQRWFLDRIRLRSAARLELACWLLDDPAGFRGELLAFLEKFAAEVFDHEWRRQQPKLRAEAGRSIASLRRHGLAVLREFSPTAVLHEGPRRVVYDKLYQAVVPLNGRHCVVLPSTHVHPHFVIKHLQEWPVTIQYSLRDRTGESALSTDDVRARMSALNDPTRAQMCRAIARRPYSTAELAQDMGMAPEQTSRHLRRLREAELVRTTRQGRLVLYELDTAAVEHLGRDILDTFRR